MLRNKLLVWVALGCILMQLSTEVKAACVCKEKGTDYCEACDERRIVRPKPRYYEPNAELELPPIGDNCWCSKVTIEPAALPKPCPKHNTPSCSCKTEPNYDYGGGRPLYPVPQLNYAYSKPKDDSLPADPISVSLAIQAGKAIEVPEAKLAYGFVQKPVDGLKKVYFSSVPEENLFKLKNDVITLKKRPLAIQKEEEEDLYEEEEEEGLIDGDEQPHLTYKQLGYVPEQFKNPKFREVSSAYVINYDDEAAKPVRSKVYVDCGYRPGRVSYVKVGKPEKIGCREDY